MLKRSIRISALALAMGCAMQVQAQRDCGTMAHDAYLRATDPAYAASRDQVEQFTQNYIATHPDGGERTVVTVPVVVHVVYHTATQNISDAQILSQIDVLNQDYRRTNPDAVNTPAYFAGVAADCEINFCLASVDPSGNPTTGIVRVSTTRTSFSTDDKVKHTSQGGDDAWPATDYLNMWVCNLGGGLLGYAQFPGGPASTDGVVILYSSFGNTGYVISPYDLGRTATHEVGHWLNLYHTWGDDGTSCTGTDYCADTPNQADETYGCPSGSRVSCSNGPNGDMYENYMDYTDDACMNIFTNDQVARMQALFAPGGTRYSILSSNGCGGGGGVTCNVPTGMNTSAITSASATLSWSAVTGAASYNVRYKLTSAPSWTNTTSTTTSKSISGLSSGSDYEWQVQTDCGGGSTSAFSASTDFSTTGGGGTCTDIGEPNGTSGSATLISAGTTYNALIANSGDVDYYKFTTTSPNTKIKVSLTSLPADYDIRLYNQSLKQKGISQNSGTADETIIWNTNQPGTRYLKVYGYGGAFNASDCYDLLVQTSSSSWRTEEGANVFEDNYDNSIVSIFPNPATSGQVTVDYFSVQEDMHVTVQVIDILGRVVKTVSSPVSSGENMINLDISGFQSGLYIVQISNGKSFYTDKFMVN